MNNRFCRALSLDHIIPRGTECFVDYHEQTDAIIFVFDQGAIFSCSDTHHDYEYMVCTLSRYSSYGVTKGLLESGPIDEFIIVSLPLA